MTYLEALLNSPIKIDSKFYNGNMVINNTLKIWKQIKSFLDLPHIYLESPVCKNYAFSPGFQDKVFSQCKQKGLFSIRDFYIDNKFGSFSQLQLKYYLLSTDFFSGIYKLGSLLGNISRILKI